MGSFTTGAYLLFFFLSAAIVGFSLLMLFSHNFVHSAVYLAAALLSFAGIYALLSATFIALLQVFIYAGAITVLVVFVVMMTRTGVRSWRDLAQPQWGVAAFVVAVFGGGLLTVLTGAASLLPRVHPAASTEQIAVALMERYAVPFELSSLILLAALIGAIYLVREAER